ncbi:putative phosphatidate cytidylyltransferase [Aspergillus saccharolyticus JOP 1030-1]|uniref:Diphthine--ammonia ligase n=1 Tax=Aspergillus saccharolyticus JOP 1030-1 TaxID=1450539 RepID=A0A318Z0P9_9EURO|nr:hypothetical protein BP01DRAFT_419410 [Aspergillus saccharolyticus JOP 1030-1]PYH40489.1 hypothetical protein BP01DRAFT_419410 [Aspergillus saccharolyticus JOP 1030-1]
MPPQSQPQPPAPPPGSGLNVIALISGGKDSLYSLLHCIRNGHKVVALANLHPAARKQQTVPTTPPPSSPSSIPPQDVAEEEEQDLDSFMYQTIGHSIIPLYETALGIPLYRQPIRGGAVDTSRIYRLQAEDQMAESAVVLDGNCNHHRHHPNNEEPEEDETESLIPLLRRIMQAHPEANAVSAGAILSTYQRTRIENVAARLGLVPLAWLWQYPLLPDRRRAPEAGLLEDMAAAGCEARIIKVASGGLDEGFLWGDVAAADGRVRARIVKGMRRFADAGDLRGAVLGEGGEYETLALDGPSWLWKSKIEVAGWEGCVGDGGVGFVKLKGATCVGKEGGEGDASSGPESVRRPDLLDERFEEVLGSVLEVEVALGTTEHNKGEGLEHAAPGVWSDGLDTVQTTEGRTWIIANVTAPEAGPGAGEQMKAISDKIQAILRSSTREESRTTADIVFTTVLLRSMSDFPLMNSIYISMFKKPNPPARATVACGDSLPEGVNVMVSAVVDLGPRDDRQGLHVQSRSYWAPANIGPYSQAMSTPMQGFEQLVYIAGQIPLEPASMEVYGSEQTWFKGFSSRAVLSLQHLWRIGAAMHVDWWLGAVAFLGGADHISQRAKIAWNLWETMHSSQQEEEDVDDGSGLDAWDLKYGGRAHEQVMDASKPKLPRFDVVQSEGSAVPAFFAVQVEELPRGSDIEWQGLGLRCDKLNITTEEKECGQQTVVTTGHNMGYIAIEVKAQSSGSGLESCLRPILQQFTQEPKSPHVTIYTTQPLSKDPSWGQIIPCKSVWGSKAKKTRFRLLIPPAITTSLSSSPPSAPSPTHHLVSRPIRSSQEEDGLLPIKDPASDPEAFDSFRQLSRSPHPYARPGSHSPSLSADPGDRSKPPRWPRTSSDSGTEADDESTGLLRGLPAPPLRPRKGLRSSVHGAGEIDQWLPGLRPWPSITRSISRSSRQSSGDDAGVGTAELREREYRRKQVAVLQRLLETALLLSVGVVVLGQEDARAAAWAWQKELAAFFFLVIGLYTAYPLHRDGRMRLSRLFTFVVPSAFDPAPLLYPVLIPIYVSLSLAHHNPYLILPNILLSLSSLPAQIVPLREWVHGHSVVHWLVTLIPIIVSEHLSAGPSWPTPLTLRGLDAEVLTLIFPFHQALIPTLDFLLTTSILPAELQLLTIALINLYLFAASPQAEILKALLWLGGMCTFIVCRGVLRWEVALARIPTWKFRRSPSASQSPRSIFNVIDHKLCQKLSRTGSSDDTLSDSDSPDGHFVLVSRKTMFDPREKTPSQGLSVTKQTKGLNGTRRRSRTAHRRRHTFSSLDDVKRAEKVRTTPGGRKKRSMAPGLASFLSLTVPQAQVRKWLYALYIYLAILTIIMVPIRHYVSGQALQKREPFGWALGYLFGNISAFRFWVLMWGLEYWIPLPARLDGDLSNASCALGWVEHLRQDTFGEANSRLLIAAYCVLVLVTGLAVVLQLSPIAEVDTRRKVFHGMMVLMFLPTIYIDPLFCALALSLALAIFLLLDLFRASQLPPISRPLTYFLAPYVDGRDHRGPVIVSHIFLLIGCSIPLWLSLADVSRIGEYPWEGWNSMTRDVSMVSGIICVGMGDAAASLIGRRVGRRKWFWGGGKSLEGSVAFAVAVTSGLILARTWLTLGQWHTDGRDEANLVYPWLLIVFKAILAAGGTSATEAILTGCNDNVVVPIVLWLLVRGLGI